MDTVKIARANRDKLDIARREAELKAAEDSLAEMQTQQRYWRDVVANAKREVSRLRGEASRIDAEIAALALDVAIGAFDGLVLGERYAECSRHLASANILEDAIPSFSSKADEIARVAYHQQASVGHAKKLLDRERKAAEAMALAEAEDLDVPTLAKRLRVSEAEVEHLLNADWAQNGHVVRSSEFGG